jgi:hypothetical protein
LDGTLRSQILIATVLAVAVVACQIAKGDGLDDPIAGARDGRAAAQHDIRNDDMAILGFAGGMRPVGAPEPPVRYDGQTGLKIRPYGGGCIVEPYFEAYMRAYNETIRAHVAQTHGRETR